MEEEIQNNIDTEKLKRLYKTKPESSSLILILVGLLSYFHWDLVDHNRILLWDSLMIFCSIYAAIIYFLFKQVKTFNRQNISYWHNLSSINSLSYAFLWGLTVFIILPIEFENQIVIILTLAGIASSAVNSLSFFKRDIFLYLFLILSPAALYFLIAAQPTIIGILLLLYVCFLALNAYRLNKDLTAIITQQLQSEKDKKEIQEKTEIHQKLFENAPFSIAYFSKDGYCLDINKAFTKLTSASVEHFVGMDSFISIRSEDVRLALKKSLDGGIGFFEGNYWVEKEQKYKYLIMHFFGIKDIHGEIDGGIVIIEDFSERKQNELDLIKAKEEAEKAAKVKSEFLSKMSHELRTPLNAIIGFTQLLEINPSTTPEQKDQIYEISIAGNMLLTQINETLDLARLEAGTLSIDIEKVDLDHLFIECTALISPLASQADIKIINKAEGLSFFVLANESKLKQSIINLLSNAIKYNFSKKGKIIIKALDLKTKIRIEVIDNGIGIAEDKISQVFQAYARINIDKNVEGTGIGLSITKNLVNKMHGEVGVESQAGIGSVFWIELPKA